MKENRMNELVDYVSIKKNVSLENLAEKFNVSIFTIRRDIDELSKRGILIKHYGSVSISDKPVNTPVKFIERNTLNLKEKTKIGEIAAQQVNDGDIIFIDAGTTTMSMCDYLKDKKITLITNNIYIILKMYNVANINLFVLGGEVDNRTNSIIGIQAINYLKNYSIDKAFIGTTGISIDHGLTNYTAIEAEIKKICIEISKKSYILVDTSKFDQSSLVKYAKLTDVSAIVSSSALPQPYTEYCQNNGIEILCDLN